MNTQTLGMQVDYNTVTETPGVGASKQQLSMLYGRYRFAAPYCEKKDVLEVACGTGQGLGYLAKTANRVVGGDIDDVNLRHAHAHYDGRSNIEVIKIDAHQLPFGEHSFDTILLYEAIYYLENPEKFLKECARVLRPGGTLIICSVNREWSDFNPSPFSQRYFSALELTELFGAAGFNKSEIFGAFPVDNASLKSRVISRIKRTAVSLNLIPKTMKGKEWLKRVVFGPLSPLPAEVQEGLAEYVPPVQISPNRPCPSYKVIYIKGQI